jgi:archaemetzincin
MPRRAVLALLIIAVVHGNDTAPEGGKVPETIYIVPFGKADTKTVETLCRPLERTFGLKTMIRNQEPVPREAYNTTRGQYLSTAFLDALRRKHPGDASKALAVADVDLYVPRLNFIFGEAEKPGRVAVISLTRLRPEYYGQPADKQLFSERMIKEAIHELGHTFGLWHCLNPVCVMFFSNSLPDTDRKGSEFCARCARQLKYHGTNDSG